MCFGPQIQWLSTIQPRPGQARCFLLCSSKTFSGLQFEDGVDHTVVLLLCSRSLDLALAFCTKWSQPGLLELQLSLRKRAVALANIKHILDFWALFWHNTIAQYNQENPGSKAKLFVENVRLSWCQVLTTTYIPPAKHAYPAYAEIGHACSINLLIQCWHLH